MAFITFQFYIFLLIVLGIYYILPLNIRWYSLLISSLAFYWYISEYSLKHMGMFIGATVLCWIFSILMVKAGQLKKVILIINLSCIVIPLLVIKEWALIESVFKYNSAIPILVPIGIAFYSMQQIAYVVDVYKGIITPEKNILKYTLFVSFFPQILQGPIPRFKQLSNQLIEGHRFSERKFVKGFMLIIWGFFLKLCIADKAAIIVNTVFDNYPTYKGVYIIVGIVLYSFQLYTDFMSCTSFAQGISELFGIDIADNFNHPFFATSIKDFWRRWHISLSTWLRDYIYIPLGGSKKGRIRKYVNLALTFLVSAVWHGSGIQFLVWGLMQAVYQIVGELLEPLKSKIQEKFLLHKQPCVLQILKITITFILFNISLIIFKADNLRTGISMLKSALLVHNVWVLTNDSLFGLGLEWKECMVLTICLFMLLLVSKKQEDGVRIRDQILECNLIVRWVIYIGAIIFIMVFGTYGYGYNAQAFIYGGF